jgi:hypothetical protein
MTSSAVCVSVVVLVAAGTAEATDRSMPETPGSSSSCVAKPIARRAFQRGVRRRFDGGRESFWQRVW